MVAVVEVVFFVVCVVFFVVCVVFAVVAVVLCAVVAVVLAAEGVCDAVVPAVSAQEQKITDETASASVPSKSFFILNSFAFENIK